MKGRDGMSRPALVFGWKRVFLPLLWVFVGGWGTQAFAQGSLLSSTMDAETLRMHMWSSGSLEDMRTRRVYRIHVPSTSVVRIETRGREAAPVCGLFNGRRQLVVEDSGTGLMSNCDLEVQLPRGDYFLQVRPSPRHRFGTYEIRYTRTTSTSARTHGETRQTARRLRERQEVEAVLARNETHWYELVGDADYVSKVEVRGDTEVSCAILDSRGTVLSEGRRSGSVNCLVEMPGYVSSMRLRIESRRSSAVGAYTLRYTRERVRDDHASSRTGATRLRARQYVDGYVTPRDIDMFRFSPRSSSSRDSVIYAESREGTDLRCRLLNDRGSVVEESRRGSRSRQCEIHVKGDGRTTYYFEVQGDRSSSAGPYRVRYED